MYFRMPAGARGIGGRTIAEKIVAFGPIAAPRADQSVIPVNVTHSITVGAEKRRITERGADSPPYHRPEKFWRDLGLGILPRRFDEA